MKVYRFFIGEMPIEDVEPFIEQVTRFTFIDVREPATPTHRSEFIDLYFEDENIDIPTIISGFKVRYVDVSHCDLASDYRSRTVF